MYSPLPDINKHKNEYNIAINNVLSHGRFINGPEVSNLSEELCVYTRAKYCIPCGNGTDALQISLRAIDIQPSDEVITVSFSWISSAEVISLCGATPVFIDIDKNYLLDIAQVEKAITHNTKAIIAVSLFGQLPDYKSLYQIAKKYNIFLIEDGAQSFGSIKDGYISCGCIYTDIATTSFFPSKTLGCFGDGGAIFTNNNKLYEKLKAISNHGCLERFNHQYIGTNSRLDSIQASILLVKLKYLNNVLFNRHNVALYYIDKLNHLKDIILPSYINGDRHVWTQFSILTTNKNMRNYLVKYMKNSNIDIAIFYPKPIHIQECYNDKYKNITLPITEDVCDRIINLPCYAELSKIEQDKIINIFIDGLYSYYV